MVVATPKTPPGFAAGFFATFSADCSVSLGVLPDTVVAENRLEHEVEFDPVELTQAASAFASELIVACGTMPLPVEVAGATPVVVLTIVPVVAKAAARASVLGVLVAAEPSACTPLMNAAIEYTEATVVTSLMATKVVAALASSLAQGPSAVIIAMAVLTPEPASPPVATI